MIESPLIKEIVDEAIGKVNAKTRQDDIVTVLRKRLGEVPPRVVAKIKLVSNADELSLIFDIAFDCDSFDTFEARIPNVSTSPKAE